MAGGDVVEVTPETQGEEEKKGSDLSVTRFSKAVDAWEKDLLDKLLKKHNISFAPGTEEYTRCCD